MHVFVAQDAIVIHRVKGLQCNRLQLPLFPFIASLQTAYISPYHLHPHRILLAEHPGMHVCQMKNSQLCQPRCQTSNGQLHWEHAQSRDTKAALQVFGAFCPTETRCLQRTGHSSSRCNCDLELWLKFPVLTKVRGLEARICC